MIDPRELRIGNLIGLDLKEYPQNYFKVLEPTLNMKVTSAIYSENIKRIETDFYDPDDMEGIPLSEEWLKKFGFERDTITGIYIKFRVGYFELWYDGLTKTFLADNIKMLKVFVTYVHQLQNLYFSLTGTELKISQ